MGSFMKMVGNWHTTLVGIAGGLAIYLGGVGMTMPHTSDDWWKFGVSLVVVVLGVVAKDAKTGSEPS